MSAIQQIVVVGASLGGTQALKQVFSGGPLAPTTAVALVQHRGESEGEGLLRLLGRHIPIPIEEPDDKTPLDAGKVFLAPAGYHLLVGEDHFALSTEGSVSGARPSIDALFESAARAFGARTTAVVLTAASHDGAAGAARIEAAGGEVLVQNPSTAESPLLPEAVLDRCAQARVLSLQDIGLWLAGSRS